MPISNFSYNLSVLKVCLGNLTSSGIFIVIEVIYFINSIFITLNTLKNSNEKHVIYNPRIKFLK